MSAPCSYDVNSLAPGKFEWKFRQVIFKLISVINGWGILCEMIPRRMWLDLTDDKSTLVQVMAWCQVLCRHIASLGHNELTLIMLNCLKDYKRYIHILNPILDLAWPNQMKLTLEQQYVLSVLHNQYHACWCPSDFGSQGISRHGIDPPKPQYSFSVIRRVDYFIFAGCHPPCMELVWIMQYTKKMCFI